MRKNIKNALEILVDGVDLTTVSNIQFYVRQEALFFEYSPEVIAADCMLMIIPLEDALQLNATQIKLQFAFVDEDGNPRASGIVQIPVGELLKEAGYDPV